MLAGEQEQFSWENSARGNDEAPEVLTVLRVFSDGECGPLRTGICADARIKKNEDHILGPLSQNNRRIVATFFQVTAMFLGFVSLRKRSVFSESE